MKMKLKDYTGLLLEGKFQENEKLQFREDMKNFGRFGEHIYNGRGMKEVVESVKNLAERAQEHALDEAGEEGWFEAVTVKKNMKEVQNNAKLFEKTATEMGALQQRMEALYEDMAHSIGRYYEVGELAGKDVLPADNDFTANGEEDEEEENGTDEQFLPGDYYDTRSAKPKKIGEVEEQFPAMPLGGSLGLGLDTLGGGTGTQVGMGDLQDEEEEELEEGPMDVPGGFNSNNNRTGANAFNSNGGGAGAIQTNLNKGEFEEQFLPGDYYDTRSAKPKTGLGDLMSDEEVNNVKENYWTLQSAQGALMEDDEGVEADKGAPGIAINKSTEWKARNESRADYIGRMKKQLGKI